MPDTGDIAEVSRHSALSNRPMPSQLGHWLCHTWQGSSHFSPRQPGAHVQVPSWVLQAPPLRHWQVRLQLKPQVPLGQLMEQSTPCQPAATRTPEHGGNNGAHQGPQAQHREQRRCREAPPSATTQVPRIHLCYMYDQSKVPGARGTTGLLG